MVCLSRLLNACACPYATEVAEEDLAMDVSSMTGLRGLKVTTEDREASGSLALSVVFTKASFCRFQYELCNANFLRSIETRRCFPSADLSIF